MADDENRALLEEALDDLHKNETFERALGRILRRHGKGFEVYLEIMDAVRDRAQRERVDLVEAARRQTSGP